MDFLINGDELEALSGLPHIQQLTYLRGIRPYMDAKTAITGIKRRISYQSISEQLYIEPHQGIKSQRFSRDQIRRSVAGLERAGVIEVKSVAKQLILKCLLASQHLSIKNKAAINPPHKVTNTTTHIHERGAGEKTLKPTIKKSSKAAIPQKENNYIYLLQQFEQFWAVYPEKKSREHALEVFAQINPDKKLLIAMTQALNHQIQERAEKKAGGHWVPAWKYPANWLAQKCWEDEIKKDSQKDEKNANKTSNTMYYKSTVDEVYESIERFKQQVVLNQQQQNNLIIDDDFFEVRNF